MPISYQDDCVTCTDVCSPSLVPLEIQGGVCSDFITNTPVRLFFRNVNSDPIELTTLNEAVFQGFLDATDNTKIVATPVPTDIQQIGVPTFNPNAVVTVADTVTQESIIIGTDQTANVTVPLLRLSAEQKKSLSQFINCSAWRGQLSFFWSDIEGALYYYESQFDFGAGDIEAFEGFRLSSQAMTSLSIDNNAGALGSNQANTLQMNFSSKWWDCSMKKLPTTWANTIQATP